jgi:light-regulated signal transduction histidine kinase (bacteriophytochrome)
LSVNADWIIVRASENTRPHTGLDPDQLVGQLAERCMDTDVLHDIRGRLQLASAPGVVERLFGQRLTPGGSRFDIAVHQSGVETIMEFEPSEKQEASALGHCELCSTDWNGGSVSATYAVTRPGRCAR